MPLVRVGVRNEYALGAAELYKEADKEDPKAVLDGVTVSGLVGILRQLGDVVEFAAEVFHGLQEQVMITSSRSRKLIARVQSIETALPSFEKSILAQQSHLHFAYTTGSKWHTHSHCEENHFIYSDLPRFLMDSYEKCRGPPRLHFLDKFDPGGSGSCLKRYSDPTFFKRASAGSGEAYIGKILKDKKGRKFKKKRLLQKNREGLHGVSLLNSSRMESREIDGQTSPFHKISTQEGASCRSFLMYPDVDKAKEIPSSIKSHNDNSKGCYFSDEKKGDGYFGISLSEEKAGHISSLYTKKELRRSEGDNNCSHSSSTLSQMNSNCSLDSVHLDEKCGHVYGDISNVCSEECNGVTWNGKRQLEEDKSGLSKDSAFLEAKTQEISFPLKIRHEDLLDCSFCDEKRGDICVGISLSEEQTNHIPCHDKMKELRRLEEDSSRPSFSTSLHANSNCSLDNVNADKRSGHICNNYSEEHNGVTWNGNRQPQEDDSRLSFPVPLQTYSYAYSNGTFDHVHSNEKGGDIYGDMSNGFSVEHRGVTWNGKRQPEEDKSRLLFPVALQTDSCPYSNGSHDPVHVDEKSGDIDIGYSEEHTAVIGNGKGQPELNASRLSFPDPLQTDSNGSLNSLIPDEKTDDMCADVRNDFSEELDAFISYSATQNNIAGPSGLTPIESLYSPSHKNQDTKSIESDFFQKQNCSDPPCNTLDGKMSSLHIPEQLCNVDGNLESYSANVSAVAQTTAVVTLGTVEHIYLPLENKRMQISKHGDTLFDELDCEADDVVDAFNSIDSELGRDLDCQTKKHVDSDSYLNAKVAEDIVSKVIPRSVDNLSPNLISEAGEIPNRKVNLNESSDARDTSDVEPITNLPSSDCVSGINGSEDNLSSVKFWTNGGLLGLEPSKPPDSVLKDVTGVPMAIQDDASCSAKQSIYPTDEMNARRTSCVTENGSKYIEENQQSVRCSSSNHNIDGVSLSNTSSRFASVGLDTKMEKSNSSCQQNYINSVMGQENVNNSSRILSLGNRLLVNGCHNNLSSLGSANRSVQKNQSEDISTAKTFTEKRTNISRSGSPVMSPSWSPPLGHIKISFQPIDGFETHKLKLRFPDRGDMFPSFHLVPEAAVSFHDISSDSDDETFCRSSVCMSDDCLSHQSESNSDEQWESGESSGIKDHEIYDALQRISLVESSSTSFDNKLTTQGEELQHDSVKGLLFFSEHSFEQSTSGCFYDLPVLDTLRPALQQPHNSQLMKSMSDVTDGSKDDLLNGHNYALGEENWMDTCLHQPKPVLLNQDLVSEPVFQLKSKRLDMQQIDERKVANQTATRKEMGEKGDFLHQIRAKSLSLRSTFTAKPTHPTGLPPGVNAILEKANAIRQAVGSDGEDDYWSDT
ncbi:unnamed protein product [Cuscuta epithymum]|uniref:Protein SCAR n=1 Tax=Cuscuta epithymum TaxID=186058 RepID=A0AAV0CI94_9ASTE|nr:unnamed protein product [Cuscuta epithymum]